MKRTTKIQFTTTSCLRPDVLNQTYKSFTDNFIDLDNKNCKLYINIDRSPSVNIDKIDQCIYVCKQYFGQVIVNCPQNPNFTNALKWCWSKPVYDYFFHLQDDWILSSKLSMSSFINYYKRFFMQSKNINNMASVNLRAYSSCDSMVCLSPGIFNSGFARLAVQKLNNNFNPQQQLRQKTIKNTIGGVLGKKFITHKFPRPCNQIIIHDIGRIWLKKEGIERNGDKYNFTGWNR